MGILNAGERDQATRAATANLTAPAQATTGVPVRAAFNLAVSGTFTGSIVAEKSFDAGVTWIPAFDQAGVAIAFSAPAARTLFEPEAGVAWRLRAATLGSGTAAARVSQ